MSAMPVFSYAQAAKGAKAQAPPKPAERPAKVEPVEASVAATATATATATVTATATAATAAATATATRPAPKTDPIDKGDKADKTDSASRRSMSRPGSTDEGKEKLTTGTSPVTEPVTTTPELSATDKDTTTTSPKVAPETASPKEPVKDVVAKKPEGREAWEKGSQSSHSQSQDKTASADKDKAAKDSEDDWDKVSVPSVATDKELKAAPLPAVNVWSMRMEALAAKKKEQAAKASVHGNGTHSPTEAAAAKPAVDESKRKAATANHSTADKAKADASGKGHYADFSTQSPRPVSQHGEKPTGATTPAATATARPPVDTTSWPTPENATADERRKSYIQDKSDKAETPKSATTKSHGNKWITVPFVPTAKFETPLPALASKRGSRTGRGRDHQARGNAQSAVAAADRADRADQASGTMGPPPVPNKANQANQAQDQDRGRKNDAARANRSSSLPASNRRHQSRENGLSSLRKSATPVKDGAIETDGGHVNGTSGTATSNNQSRSSSRHQGASNETAAAAAAPSLNTNANAHATGHSNAVVASAPNGDAPARAVSGQDRTKPAQPHYRTPADAKDRGSHRNRDWSREKSDAAREKVESWRDRDFSSESTGRRERSDRGRGGGGYRGRGGSHPYNSHQSHQSHSYTAPLPQNGFEPAKPHHAEPRSRQSSQPFVLPNSGNPNRAANPRSHSIPVGMMYSSFYGVPGMQHLVPQLQTDIPPYAAYAAGPVPVDQAGGVMSAMPYSNSLNSYAVMSMVVTQFEYYFSIDNLCKDMYLRKNMDSQGWVPLRVVANFKRIKALTEENFAWELMRYVAGQVRNAEHLPMPDGEDKLRSREQWRNFVLPIEDRFPAAQSDGPPPHIYQQQQQLLQQLHQQLQQQQQPLNMFPAPPPPPPAAAGAQPAGPPPPGADGLPAALSSPVRSPNAAIATPNGSGGGAGFEQAPLPHPPSSYGPVSPLDGSVVDHGFGLGLSPSVQGSGSPPPPLSRARQESPSLQKSQYPRVFRDRPTGQMVSPTPNGHRRQPSRNFTEEVTFPDEGIADIRILVREPSSQLGPEVFTGHQLSRALSNESRGSGGASAGAGTSVQPGLPAEPGLQADSARFFDKDGQQSDLPAEQPGHYSMSYLEAHEFSFRNRAMGFPEAMSTMYSFWSSFLVDNFNLGMYQDFKNTGIQDLASGNESGINHLVQYYDRALKSQAPIADVVATDLAHFLRDEADGKARVYKILRMAWRNGALNLKTRKKIGDLLSDEEKASFDKGG